MPQNLRILELLQLLQLRTEFPLLMGLNTTHLWSSNTKTEDMACQVPLPDRWWQAMRSQHRLRGLQQFHSKTGKRENSALNGLDAWHWTLLKPTFTLQLYRLQML